MFPGLYNEARAAQAAAYLLSCAGGSLEIIKLMKLMYLSERISLQRFGLPLTGDTPYSMQFGPILSRVYDSAKDFRENPESQWSVWMLPRNGNDIELRRPLVDPVTELRDLPTAAFTVISEVWAQFGDMAPFELVDYLHRHCPEWVDPGPTSKEIAREAFFDSIGFNSDEDRARIDWLDSIQEALNRG